MAQVYAFTDQNGDTRLFAEIHPDPAGTPFNGGTITNALILNKALAPNTSDLVLQILDPNNPDSVVNVQRVVDGSGNESLSLSLAAALDGTANVTLADDNFDGGTTITSGGNSTLYARSTISEADPLLSLGTAAAQGARFLRDGYLVIRLHAAPADASLRAGDLVFWFDQTDSAGKLMIKAKTADGTVATAAVALT